MAKVINQFNSVDSVLRKFIARNRATLENYIKSDPSITIHADGMVEIHFVACADAELATDLNKVVKHV